MGHIFECSVRQFTRGHAQHDALVALNNFHVANGETLVKCNGDKGFKLFFISECDANLGDFQDEPRR